MITLISLIIVGIVLLVLLLFIKKYNAKSKKYKYFYDFLILLMIPIVSLSFQIIFSNTKIPLIYFDYFTYVFTFIAPIKLLQFSIEYGNFDSTKFANIYKLLNVISIMCLLTLWTNDLHNMFYIKYSTSFLDVEYGIFFYISSVYAYVLLIASMLILILGTVRKSGFLSIQSMLILIGVLVPLIGNILSVAHIIDSNIYLTPILFGVFALCSSLAIFKFKALNITPIAFRTIIDTMSDAYIVISNEGTIVDNNQTFHKIFKDILNDNKEDNFFIMLEEKKLVDTKDLKSKIDETRKNGNIVSADYHFEIIDEQNSTEDETKYIFNRYFEVDIHPIKASRGKEYVGTLLLFKDVTQHMEDMQELQEKQDVIIKQQQLVSIGELAGGVAHDINTPISAIKTGITMMNTFYEPRDDREKELITRMDNCADRIIKIVNSMRNQIRNLGNTEKVKFKVSDVLKDTQVITFNEFQKNKCTLNINIQDDVEVMGEPTKLGQVFTNLVVNAAQAYPEGQGGKVEVDVSNAPEGKCIIKIRDYAGGIPDRIKDSVFKNILTTKGTKGTGLGLYLAYSVIKGEFSGDITFETEQGEGTTFYIVLDRADSIKPKGVEEKQEVKI